MSYIQVTLKKFLSSSKNQTGLILLASTIPGYIVQLQSHNISIAVAAGTLFAGLLHIIIPDNTILTSDAAKLLTDALAATDTKNLSEIPKILSDAAKLGTDMTPAAKTAVKG